MSTTGTIFRRELSSYFNSPVAYVFIMMFVALAGVLTFMVFNFYEGRQANLDRFFQAMPWLFLFLVPAVAMSMWSEERRSKTIEILFTLPVKPEQAVLGKFFSAWLLLGLVLLLTLPMVWTVYYLGEPDSGAIVAGYFGTFLLAGTYLSIGMFASALSKSPIIAFILAVSIGFVLVIIGLPPVTQFLQGFLPQALVDVISGLSFWSHHDNMTRGLITLRDLLYFVGIIAFMLYATVVVLREKASA